MAASRRRIGGGFIAPPPADWETYGGGGPLPACIYHRLGGVLICRTLYSLLLADYYSPAAILNSESFLTGATHLATPPPKNGHCKSEDTIRPANPKPPPFTRRTPATRRGRHSAWNYPAHRFLASLTTQAPYVGRKSTHLSPAARKRDVGRASL